MSATAAARCRWGDSRRVRSVVILQRAHDPGQLVGGPRVKANAKGKPPPALARSSRPIRPERGSRRPAPQGPWLRPIAGRNTSCASNGAARSRTSSAAPTGRRALVRLAQRTRIRARRRRATTRTRKSCAPRRKVAEVRRGGNRRVRPATDARTGGVRDHGLRKHPDLSAAAQLVVAEQAGRVVHPQQPLCGSALSSPVHCSTSRAPKTFAAGGLHAQRDQPLADQPRSAAAHPSM